MSASFQVYGFKSISKSKNQLSLSVFKNATYKIKTTIPDPISKKSNNKSIYKIYDSKKNLIGHQRHIDTTTGCNSACLPVVFDLFYDKSGKFLRILSKDGLTKKFHRPFAQEDYARLEMIILMNPNVFKKVGHPTEMVDAISGATLSQFVPSVIKDAAYSTLRINLYNQHTLKFLINIK